MIRVRDEFDVQSISVLEFRRAKANVRGPFLVVAPLTTLGHWRREIETWTHMNAVCFMGSRDDRKELLEHELYYNVPGRKTRVHQFDVLLTSFEMVRDFPDVFMPFAWDVVVVDEAHRLKGLNSQFRYRTGS
jgi:SNF2 family DNA or RNA helicase